ncbi:MAG: type II secretion system protein [Lachnospiraceae bacterium]|nr:type II secretion system protein [Lachnospiraceae bacterium]
MERRMKKLNNKGYSLIEMIIVIAIVAVLTGAAMVTLKVMHSAKVKEAAITFESEISELLSMSKNKICDPNGDGVIEDSEKEYSVGLRLYKSGSKCYIQEVLVKNGAYEANSTYENANNPNSGKGISLSTYVDVKYTDLSGNSFMIGTAEDKQVTIHFKRNGSCDLGYGTFDFIRNSSNSKVATMTINKNGSHQAK